jgi:pimeloyl-ACP methyl ester carboxylesterase
LTTILFVHAFPLDASMWDDQVTAVREDTQVLAPSFPGFGGTPAAGDVLTMDAIADFLVGKLDAAGIDRALVCGLSIGGYASFALWRRHRDRIAGLVLANTRAGDDDEQGRERRRALADRVLAEGSAAAAEALVPLLLSEGADDRVRERVRQVILRQPPEAIAAASLGMAERPDSTPDLPGIDVPVAVVGGTEDGLTPLPHAEAMAEAIPDVELTVIEGAGHLSNLEFPERFNEAVRNLLARIE